MLYANLSGNPLLLGFSFLPPRLVLGGLIPVLLLIFGTYSAFWSVTENPGGGAYFLGFFLLENSAEKNIQWRDQTIFGNEQNLLMMSILTHANWATTKNVQNITPFWAFFHRLFILIFPQTS